MLMTAIQKPNSLPKESKKTRQKQNLPFHHNNATLYIPQSQPSHILSYLFINRIIWGVTFVVETCLSLVEPILPFLYCWESSES